MSATDRIQDSLPPPDGVVSRRDILRLGGLVAAGSLAPQVRRAMAGPFSPRELDGLVPADKKLSGDWVRSLFVRGTPEWFSSEELGFVGMPVGGICCGHVYLGGDGRLWHWDIFNQHIATGSGHYQSPMPIQSPVDLGVQIRVESEGRVETRSLDREGFPELRFRGAYPMGFVEYGAGDFPVEVSLEAFSPFVPLDVESSSLPLTVLCYTVRNASRAEISVSLAGALVNPVLCHTASPGEAELLNVIRRGTGLTGVQCTAVESRPASPSPRRPDIPFDDFESDSYSGWEIEGSAFGKGPVAADEMPSYQGDVGAHGKRLVNSHNTRQGEDVRAGDAHVGVMTSRPFTIERRFINLLIGGGAHRDETCLNVLVEGEIVASVTGKNHNRLRPASLDVGAHAGKTARIQIVDRATGGWGNIGVDNIVFSERPADPRPPIEERTDMGDMVLAVLGDSGGAFASASTPLDSPERFSNGPDSARASLDERPVGVVGESFTLAPGEDRTVSLAVAWRFPNAATPVGKGHHYAERFASGLEALEHLVGRQEELYETTRRWHKTWYDSTLPHWFLDRTFVNTSTLATSTCLRVGGGRFWGWEGVRCCPGTCSHVWHYAQAVGRVFPELERMLREQVDYGLAFQPDGSIFYRAEYGRREAIDGQCGTILRVLREHQMSADDGFLRRIWPRVKKSVEFLVARDGDDNGILEGEQYNTLDASWYGPISWISSLYVAALRAGAAMANEMGDVGFAERCEVLAALGGQYMVERLYNGEYFFQQRDPEHPQAFGSGMGCHIDQVLGQGWAHQVGLPRVLPREQTVQALRSLWRYNFAPDVGPYRQRYRTGRWYAMPGEAGLIMCTFPRGGEREARGGRSEHVFAGYLNECMNGFEYQAAGHMIAEGLVREGLAVTRAIHDRYHPSRRNPYNEIECGDHYARSMASFGVYLSLCGFDYHGPRGHIGFAPKLAPEDFRAAFIAAEGWGTFGQQIQVDRHEASVRLAYGRLRLRTLALEKAAAFEPSGVRVRIGDRPVPATFSVHDNTVTITFGDEVVLDPSRGTRIEILGET